MKILNVKINGIRNPIGFSYDTIKCSWIVEEFISKKQAFIKIEVSMDPAFEQIYYVKEGTELSSIGEVLEMDLEPRTTYYFRVFVQGDEGEAAVSEVCWFETGKMTEKWMADWIGPKKEYKFHPILFRSFITKTKINRARIYVCGLGLYEAFLNGVKIGKDYLAPFINDYFTELQYQSYDITNLVQKENSLEICLGNGWYKGRFGLDAKPDRFGDRFAAIAELHLQYEDGSSEIICTDNSWKYKGSDTEYSGIYDGESINRLLWEDKDNSPEQVEIISIGKEKLVERFSLPVIVKERIMPKDLFQTPAGEWVLDMGQNFAGYSEFISRQPRGNRVVLDFGEVLQGGNFYNENYRSAKPRFEFVGNGELETVRPQFTYYGFRYIRLTGWIGELSKEDFTGCVVYSDLDSTGSIETSNEKINRLFLNCVWSQKSNFLDIPTDCPQRDERLGWTGDAQVFAATACYNMDTRAFFEKYLRDLRNEQKKLNGGIPNFIPNVGRTRKPGSVWGDAATIIPNVLYEHYGDLHTAMRYYPMMKDWVDYVTRIVEENGDKYLFDKGFHFGDWLAQDGVSSQSVKGGTDDYYIASVYYYESVRIAAMMANLIGKSKDRVKYDTLAGKIKNAILKEYFTPTGRLAIDTQTAYIVALRYKIYIDKEKLIKEFRQRLEKDGYKIKCGFVGAPLLCCVLCDNGMEDIAYHFLFQEGFPSWLYCVNLGATTIWERWNSLLEDGTVSGTGMNSFNHYAYGTVIEFIYRHIAGIQPVKSGFREVVFAPKLNSKLQYVNCSYASVSGTYVSNWRIHDDGSVSMHFEVPFNCTAKALLPRYEGGEIHLDSGTFDITYTPERDFRHIFSRYSRLDELAGNEAAMKILNEHLPQAVEIIRKDNKEYLYKSLEELSEEGFIRFSPEDVHVVIEEIEKIKS